MSDNSTNKNQPSVKRPIKINGYKSFKLHAKRNRKRDEAEDRLFSHLSLPLLTKISKAKARRGNSTKELARLQKQLLFSSKPLTDLEPKPTPSPEVVETKVVVKKKVSKKKATKKTSSKKE